MTNNKRMVYRPTVPGVHWFFSKDQLTTQLDAQSIVIAVDKEVDKGNKYYALCSSYESMLQLLTAVPWPTRLKGPHFYETVVDAHKTKVWLALDIERVLHSCGRDEMYAELEPYIGPHHNNDIETVQAAFREYANRLLECLIEKLSLYLMMTLRIHFRPEYGVNCNVGYSHKMPVCSETSWESAKVSFHVRLNILMPNWATVGEVLKIFIEEYLQPGTYTSQHDYNHFFFYSKQRPSLKAAEEDQEGDIMPHPSSARQVCIIDLAVYTNFRPWRLLYSSKWNSDPIIRTLEPHQGSSPAIYDHFVVAYPESYPSIYHEFPLDLWLARQNQGASQYLDCSSRRHIFHHADEEVNYEQVSELVSMLAAFRREEYESWLHVGMCLHNLEPSQRMLDLWIDFSRCSTKWVESESINYMTRKWATFQSCNTNNNQGGVSLLGLGSLHKWARQDSADRYKQLQTMYDSPPPAMTQKEAGGIGGAAAVDTLISYLQKRWPEQFDASSTCASSSFVMERETDGKVRFEMNGNTGYILPSSGAVEYNGEHLGLLVPGQIVNGALTSIHKDIPSKASKFVYNHDERSIATLDSLTPNVEARLCMYNMDDTETCFVGVKVEGRREFAINSKKKVQELLNKISKVTRTTHEQVFGREVAALLYVNMNIVNHGNIVFGAGSDDKKRPDDALGKVLLTVFDPFWTKVSSMNKNPPFIDSNQTGCSTNKDESIQNYKNSINLVAVSSRLFYGCSESTGLWITMDRDMATNYMRKAIQGNQPLWSSLTEAERKYIQSACGCSSILTTMINDLYMPDFADYLDIKSNCIAFTNGFLELRPERKFEFRSIEATDLISRTLGYDFIPCDEVSTQGFEFISDFYKQVLPCEDERELFLRLVGYALSGENNEKYFMLLTDVRNGNNGKSTLMAAVAEVFGNLAAPTQSNFIYQARDEGSANSHGANDLSYARKRLAIFDETVNSRQLDVAKIKRLTSGGHKISARGCGEKNVTTFNWTAFIIIACNQDCFPQINAMDVTIENRMIAIPMRSKFIHTDETSQEDKEDLTYKIDIAIKKKLEQYKVAHLHVILDAYARYKTYGLPPLPKSCIDFRARVLSAADPLRAAVVDFVNDNIEFVPVSRGHVMFAKRADVIAKFKYIANKVASFSNASIKATFDSVMKSYGSEFVAENRVKMIDGTYKKVKNYYPGCVLKSSCMSDEEEEGEAELFTIP